MHELIHDRTPYQEFKKYMDPRGEEVGKLINRFPDFNTRIEIELVASHDQLLDKQYNDSIAFAYDRDGRGFELYKESDKKFVLYQLCREQNWSETLDIIDSDFGEKHPEPSLADVASYMIELLDKTDCKY